MLWGLEHGADGHLSVPGQTGAIGVQFPLVILVTSVYDDHFDTFGTLVGGLIRLIPDTTNTATNCEWVSTLASIHCGCRKAELSN